MKVLMIAGDPRVETFGGIEEHTNNITRVLSRFRDLQLSLITFGSENEKLKDGDLRVETLKRSTSNKAIYLLLLPLDVYRLLGKIRQYHPDVVHFQGVHPLYCITAILSRKKYHTVITVHGILAVETNFQAGANTILKRLSRACERYAMSRLSYIILVGPHLEDLVGQMTLAKIWVVPNGVDTEHIRHVSPPATRREDTLFFIGNFVRLKGIDILLQALISVIGQMPNVRLLLAGSGPEEAALKKLVNQLNLSDHVEFLGFLKGDVKYTYLKASDILVVPSRWDSLPIVLLEGMACSIPIIATNVGGIPFLIKDGINGYLVNADDADELAAKLTSLLKDKALQKEMGMAGQKLSEEFTWDKIAGQTAQIYKEIVTESR